MAGIVLIMLVIRLQHHIGVRIKVEANRGDGVSGRWITQDAICNIFLLTDIKSFITNEWREIYVTILEQMVGRLREPAIEIVRCSEHDCSGHLLRII